MDPSETEITRGIDALIAGAGALEQRLSEAHGEEAHDWVFALREVLYDLRRLQIQVADLYQTPEAERLPQNLQAVVHVVLYEILPHVQAHFEPLAEELERFNTGSGPNRPEEA